MLEDKRDTRSRQLIVLLIFFLPKSGLKEKSAFVAVFNFLFFIKQQLLWLQIGPNFRNSWPAALGISSPYF